MKRIFVDTSALFAHLAAEDAVRPKVWAIEASILQIKRKHPSLAQ